MHPVRTNHSNWLIFSKTDQEKKEQKLKLLVSGMKGGVSLQTLTKLRGKEYYEYLSGYKFYNRLNWQIPQKTLITKTHSESNR